VRIVVYQDYLRVGGTESQSLYLANRLQSKGETVYLLTNRPGGRLASLAEQFHLDRQCLQCGDFRLNWFAPGLIATLRRMAPDLVLLMGRNANSEGSRIRHHFPTLPILSTVRTGRPLPKRYRRSMQVATAVICNSQYAADRIQSMKLSLPPVAIHPNACMRAGEIEVLSPADSDGDNRAHLVYVAAFVPGKNHRELIGMVPEILRKIPHLRLSLVGEGPLYKRMKHVVRRLGLEKHIVFEGYRKDLPAIFRGVDLAVSPSLEESMPNALVEAQYAGIPVIAYDVAGVKECFVPGVSGFLVKPGDPSGFAQAIIRLLKEKPLLKSMRVEALRYSRQEFNPDVRFDAFYQCVLKYSADL